MVLVLHAALAVGLIEQHDHRDLQVDLFLPGQFGRTGHDRRLILLQDQRSRFRPRDDLRASPGFLSGSSEEVVEHRPELAVSNGGPLLRRPSFPRG